MPPRTSLDWRGPADLARFGEAEAEARNPFFSADLAHKSALVWGPITIMDTDERRIAEPQQIDSTLSKMIESNLRP